MSKLERAVGCLYEYDNKILILRYGEKNYHRWGLVGGKVQPDESDMDAIIRETREEIGQSVDPGSLNMECVFDWDLQGYKGLFVAFRSELRSPLRIELNPSEHKEYGWVNPAHCFVKPDLLPGLYHVLRTLYLR